jgi:uncharacterized membrane protein YgdD (TMEM256/DUF423 family)
MSDLSRGAGLAAAIFGGLALVFGAFGAHALRDRLGVDALAVWRTAVDYQFWHALALLAIAVSPVHRGRAALTAWWSFGIGIALFSGSLYALALGAPRFVGIITPFGGLAFIVGWVALGVMFVRSRAH